MHSALSVSQWAGKCIKIKILIMTLRRLSFIAGTMVLLGFASCHRTTDATLDFAPGSSYEGERVEVMTYTDSVMLAADTVRGGRVSFTIPGTGIDPEGKEVEVRFPIFAQVSIGGRIKGFYVVEPGAATLDSTMSIASGTATNDRFAGVMARLDSIEDTNDMTLYTEALLNERKTLGESPISDYLWIEWVKYADPKEINASLADVPQTLRDSRRAQHYLRFARLRAATMAGQPYIDFEGENADGTPVSLSEYVKPGRWTLVDFWASWCPYCIKELPELKEALEKAGGIGLDIVGVAVRDTPEDTRAAVKRFDIPWPVIYNVGRRPYDIYGFSGIPHLMLIGPDGKILSRGETPAQAVDRIEKALASSEARIED